MENIISINVIEEIIKEINIDLDNNLFFSALSLSLMLPDICGKAEFPNLGHKQRYIKWYKKHVEISEKNDYCPYMSANIIYNLRCAFLHTGTDEEIVENDKDFGLSEFKLKVEEKNDFNIYVDIYSEGYNPECNSIIIDIRNLCNKIMWCAEGFLKNNNFEFPKIQIQSNCKFNKD